MIGQHSPTKCANLPSHRRKNMTAERQRGRSPNWAWVFGSDAGVGTRERQNCRAGARRGPGESGAAKSQGAEPATQWRSAPEGLKAGSTGRSRIPVREIGREEGLGTAVEQRLHPDIAPWASDDDADLSGSNFGPVAEPMWLNIVVDDTTEDGPKLTEESVRSAVESRLRSARLYSDERTDVQLVVTADRFGNPTSFQLSVDLWKNVLDINTGLRYGSITWETRVRTH